MYKFFGFLSLLLVLSCKHDPFPYNGPLGGNDSVDVPVITGKPCDPDSVYFQNDILPLILSSCATTDCHDGTGFDDDGDSLFKLTNYSEILEIIEEDKWWKSDLLEVIDPSDPDDVMPPPPNPKLSQAQIDLIVKWLEQGFLENYCDRCDTTDVKFSTNVFPVIQNNCLSCHSNPPTRGAHEPLTNHAEVVLAVQNHELFARIKRIGPETPMPKNAALDSCTVRAFELWIDDGMPNN